MPAFGGPEKVSCLSVLKGSCENLAWLSTSPELSNIVKLWPRLTSSSPMLAMADWWLVAPMAAKPTTDLPLAAPRISPNVANLSSRTGRTITLTFNMLQSICRVAA